MKQSILSVVFSILLALTGCSREIPSAPPGSTESATEENDPEVMETHTYTRDTSVNEVRNDAVFGDYGRLIFPIDEGYYSGNTLGDLSLVWYNNIDPDKTVEIANYFRDHAQAGETIFFDIYTEEEKQSDPDKRDTGLFFFKGIPNAKFAVCNAGGGFAYVGAMQDSFPHALELSKLGYNAFALIYRPGAQTAREDLSRAISFIFEHADELQVDTDGYSLWGGSAGARMAALVGSYGTTAFGGDELPQPSAVIMQYTGHSEYSESDPPTFACVGESDGIANWRIMQRRLEALSALGIDTEFHEQRRRQMSLQRPLRKYSWAGYTNEERAVLQPWQKKYGLHDRTAENNDLALLHELME